MDSRDTTNFGTSMLSPALSFSKLVVMVRPLNGPDGPAAAGTNDVAKLVEEDVVVHHEQPLTLDELVERTGLQGDDVVRPRRNIVAPGLPGIDRARRAHPVIGRRAGKHQEDMDRGRRDQPAIAGGFGVGLIEIERMILADRLAVEFD